MGFYYVFLWSLSPSDVSDLTIHWTCNSWQCWVVSFCKPMNWLISPFLNWWKWGRRDEPVSPALISHKPVLSVPSLDRWRGLHQEMHPAFCQIKDLLWPALKGQLKGKKRRGWRHCITWWVNSWVERRSTDTKAHIAVWDSEIRSNKEKS